MFTIVLTIVSVVFAVLLITDIVLDLADFAYTIQKTNRLHICCSIVDPYSSAPESNKRNPRERTLDLPFSFRYKHITSLKNLPSPTPSES